MSIATEITRLQTAKADLKTALEAKGATIPSETTLDGYPDIVDDIPVALLQDKEVSVSGGTTVIEPDTGYTGMHSVTVTASGGPVQEKTVNFIDYEGTIVASYTGVEAQALSALPNAPDHSEDEVPLTFEEWNWTLAEIKSYNTSYPNAVIWVGANYHTTDGKTHFFFKVTSDTDGYGVAINLGNYMSIDTVDWGDGSPVETISSYDLTHVYTSVGEFHCIINSDSSEYNVGGSSSTRRSTRGKLIKAYFSNRVTIIKGSAFNFCYSLQSVSIPNSVTSIGTYAFNYCFSLQSVIIPSTITSIGSCTFDSCGMIQSASIPNSVTSIGTSAFNECQSLRSVTIPNSATSIGNYAFNGCRSLQSVTIPNSVTSIGEQVFQSCQSLQSVTISDGVTSIGNHDFNSCYSLKSVTIPDSATSIGSNAFNSCYSLQSVTIPDSVTSIGDYAFNECQSLQSVTIPNSATSIGSSVFNSSYSVYAVFVLATTPPTLSGSLYSGIQKIYVPSESVEAYKTATNWSASASKIEAIPS